MLYVVYLPILTCNALSQLTDYGFAMLPHIRLMINHLRFIRTTTRPCTMCTDEKNNSQHNVTRNTMYESVRVYHVLCDTRGSCCLTRKATHTYSITRRTPFLNIAMLPGCVHIPNAYHVM
jgi:hypothetical protein